MVNTSHSPADVILRTTKIGLTITSAQITDDNTTMVYCYPGTTNNLCPGCGKPGVKRDHVTRRLTDIPAAAHPVMLMVTVPRFICHNPDCYTTNRDATT